MSEPALVTVTITEEAVKAGAKAFFERDRANGHVFAKWTWEMITPEGRAAYMSATEAALEAALALLVDEVVKLP